MVDDANFALVSARNFNDSSIGYQIRQVGLRKNPHHFIGGQIVQASQRIVTPAHSSSFWVALLNG